MILSYSYVILTVEISYHKSLQFITDTDKEKKMIIKY